eukprot:Nk52_evm1s2421 gene=Nk52_evmTU1s2421
MMPEITIGITKTARSAVLNLIWDTRPIASRSAITLTTITVHSANPKVNKNDDRIAGSWNAAM